MTIRPFSLPGSYLVLELANGCNLKCVHCAQSDLDHDHYQQTGFFPREGVRRLLADLVAYGIRFDNLVLFWLGEPLIHPEFSEIYLELLAHCGPGRTFGQLELHTNGTMLTAGMAAAVLNRLEAPQRWHLTIDASSRETYCAIKGVDLYERVEENVARLITFKGRGGFPWPQLVLQYIVSATNEAEVQPFIDRWSPAFERARLPWELTAFHVPQTFDRSHLFLKSLDCPTPAQQAQANRRYARAVAAQGLQPTHTPEARERLEAGERSLGARLETPCSGFWKSPVIGWNGILTTCTRDSQGQNQLGNVLETPFSTLWFGDGPLSSWRKAVARGDYAGRPLCQSCFIPRSINYTGITQDEIAMASKAEEVVP